MTTCHPQPYRLAPSLPTGIIRRGQPETHLLYIYPWLPFHSLTYTYTNISILHSFSSPAMGICSSCESTSVATSLATAKLILQDGRLQEFPYPVKASYVLQMDPTCFICNSDEMEFGDVMSAMSDDEELQPGQLYFALPLSRLSHRLQAEEMAALAVKASSALKKSGGGNCGCSSRKPFSPVYFSDEKGGKVRLEEGRTGGVVGGGPGSGRRRNFKAKLRAIPE